jgi:hypothetical protein
MKSPKRNWEQFALLLIDIQRDFWTEELASSFPDFPANVERLLALCRIYCPIYAEKGNGFC